MKREQATVGMLVRVDSVRLGRPWIGRVVMVHDDDRADVLVTGLVRVAVVDPLASGKEVGSLWYVGVVACYPQTED